MVGRLGLLVAASLAAFAVRQFNARTSRQKSGSDRRLENGGKRRRSIGGSREREGNQEEEEEEEAVKLISGVIRTLSSNNVPGFEDEDILPEFEEFLSRGVDFPLPDDWGEDKVYQIEMASNAGQLERLRKLVKELEEREMKLEGELLEYYGLKEQDSDVVELQRQLKIKTVEIDMLNVTINLLQAERKKLREEVAKGFTVRKELDAARNKIKELQNQIQQQANQTRGHLLLLNQQESSLQVKEEEALKRDAEVERKLKVLKELEVEVIGLKRKNRELQHEKRELTVKLDAAEARHSLEHD
ncbi:hypothetical protein MLD38_005499 [Melastoma candidum]|uniref:Uncharacterized protein n=1 Tax=Melastoma candidum TaxID=119954 RepID=A0ACB9RJL8_9MYRT|nr:hypothetical protein MLD38_005499 [Melastoma candidum]